MYYTYILVYVRYKLNTIREGEYIAEKMSMYVQYWQRDVRIPDVAQDTKVFS
jgi:hypothetical protein